MKTQFKRSSELRTYRGKRALDVVAASLLCVVTAPLTVIVALGVLATTGRPVIFRQERQGLQGGAFILYKFRTMRQGDGRPPRESDSARITGLGKFLRTTSLDELPQLYNVLRGDMSLVGPRPLFVRYDPCYREEERERFDARPGITGLAQVSGRNALTWDDRLGLDVEYVQRMDFPLDLRILLKTARVIISRRGLSANSYTIEPDLDEARRLDIADATG